MTPFTILQSPPFSNSVTAGASSTFSDQLKATNVVASAVVFVSTDTNVNPPVSKSGRVTMVAGPMKAGTCTVSGIDRDA